MATNLDIDPELLEEAMRLGGAKTKKAAVTEALREYVARRKQREILALFGAIEYEDGYDPRELRRGR